MVIIVVVGIFLGCWYAFVSLQPSERKIPQQSAERETSSSPERAKWLNYLNSPDSTLRHSAVLNFGLFVKNYDEAISILIKALEDSSVNVRMSAASILGASHNSDAIEPLITALYKDSRTAMCAVSALGNLKDKRAVPALLKFYNNPPFAIDPQVRIHVIIALASIPDKRSFNLLATLLYQEDSIVAAQGLCLIDDKKAMKVLKKHLQKKPKNSLYIKILLAGLGQEEFFPELQESITGRDNKEDDYDRISVAIAALDQLAERGDKRAIPLLKKVMVPAFECQLVTEGINAINALGRIAPEDAIAILKEILEKSDDNSEERMLRESAWALLKMRAKNAIPVIEDVLSRPFLKQAPRIRLHLEKVISEFQKLQGKDVQKD